MLAIRDNLKWFFLLKSNPIGFGFWGIRGFGDGGGGLFPLPHRRDDRPATPAGGARHLAALERD